MASPDPTLDPALLPQADARGEVRFSGMRELTEAEQATTTTLKAALGHGYVSLRPCMGPHWSATLELTWPEGPSEPAPAIDHDRIRAFLRAHGFEKTGRVLLGGTFGDVQVTEYLGEVDGLRAVILVPSPADLESEGVLHLAYFRPEGA